MVGLHEIFLSHSDVIFTPQDEVPWMVGITVTDCNDKIDVTRVEGLEISNYLFAGCGGSCSYSCSEPKETV
jgi:hypothetical protein